MRLFKSCNRFLLKELALHKSLIGKLRRDFRKEHHKVEELTDRVALLEEALCTVMDIPSYDSSIIQLLEDGSKTVTVNGLSNHKKVSIEFGDERCNRHGMYTVCVSDE